MPIVKSDLIKELADSYPNFIRKDLVRFIDLVLYEMINSIKRGERVELRDIFQLNLGYKNLDLEEIPKMEKLFLQKRKKKYFLKCQKNGQKK